MRIVITYRHGGNEEYLGMIKLAFESAKRFGYDTLLVGDQELGDMHWNPIVDKNEYLMNWILLAQLNYISSSSFDCNSVLFSPDALIVKDLAPIFEQDFDIAFTDREHSKWPINNGVIFLKPENRAAITSFWHAAISTCKSYPIETQKWYGDQQSLWDVYELMNELHLDTNVKLLPCSEYNASPDTGQKLDTKLLESAYIIHLKGKRKDMMKKYWDAICS